MPYNKDRGEKEMEYQDITPIRPLRIDRIVSIHYFEYTKDFTFSGEAHNFWEVVYADTGCLLLTAGAAEIRLSPGDFFIHRPMEFHNVRPAPGEAPAAVIFSFYSGCEKLHAVAGTVHACGDVQHRLLSDIILRAREAFSTPLGDPYTTSLTRRTAVPFGTEQLIVTQMEQFLIEVLRQNEGKPVTSSPLRHVSDPFAASVCDYLEKSITRPVTFPDLCRHFSISPSKLKKIFHEKVGCGAMDYFAACRIDCAKRMIREKEKTLTEIAETLCFSSLPHFSRQFKVRVHMTPSEDAASVRSYEKDKS